MGYVLIQFGYFSRHISMEYMGLDKPDTIHPTDLNFGQDALGFLARRSIQLWKPTVRAGSTNQNGRLS